MPDFSIYVLQEDDITLSQGAILDGVTQGDGSHLVNSANPITITLNNRNWLEAEITDDDSNFRDNDGGQELRSALTLNGTTYGAGDVVEAEYSFTVTDGTQSWTLIAFNVRDSSPAYGTVEGVAFIGPPGGFPPTGVALEITGAAEGPNFGNIEYATPICFAAGTRIEVPGGLARVETLRPGDLVKTDANGSQPLQWTGRRQVAATGAFAPVVFAPGTIGNTAELRLSQQHRVALCGAMAELHFGFEAVLVPARSFVGRRGVRIEEGGMIDYVHIMFDRHQIVFSEGAATESFYPGKVGLGALDRVAREELMTLFPELSKPGDPYGPMVFPEISMQEARLLLH